MHFLCAFGTEQAAEKVKEVVQLFCRQLEDRPEKPVMVARIEIVTNYFTEFAVRRNQRALVDDSYRGTGMAISLQIGELNSHAVEIKVLDEGGFERMIRKSRLVGTADLISFDLVNGGLQMRAVLKWRSCDG